MRRPDPFSHDCMLCLTLADRVQSVLFFTLGTIRDLIGPSMKDNECMVYYAKMLYWCVFSLFFF